VEIFAKNLFSPTVFSKFSQNGLWGKFPAQISVRAKENVWVTTNDLDWVVVNFNSKFHYNNQISYQKKIGQTSFRVIPLGKNR
jgi:hypothetical protein